MDIWFSKRWAMPEIISDYSLWQGVFGFIFFMIAMTWVFFAYIKPPYFTKYNYKVFSGELYRVILKGADDELKVIANELARSIESLIIYADSSTKNMKLVKRKDEVIKIKPSAGAYANDMLLLIGNRKFCRYIVSSSPITAITLFEVMSSKKIYNLPIGQFSTNIATEAIMNKDSILYHEDEGYRSGLIGYQKPFSKALYGDYALVESIGHNSPLDVNHRLVFSWDASQLNAYCRLVLLTLESYLIKTVWFNHSFVLNRAFRKIENSCLDIYKVNDDLSNSYSSDAYKRLEVVVDFVVQAISMVNDLNANHVVVLRPRADTARQNIYDHIAGMMFEIIFHVSSVNGDSFSVWNIQHNIVWSKFFHNHAKGKAWDIIQFKLRRLLYNEIISLEEWPNYKSSRILGYCLYVMGFNISKKSSRNTSYIALNKVIISWVKNNYLNLRRVNIDVAESCLIGRISYDEEHNRLVKTYEKGLSRKPAKSYLDL